MESPNGSKNEFFFLNSKVTSVVLRETTERYKSGAGKP